MCVMHRRGRVLAAGATLVAASVVLAGCTGQSNDPAPAEITNPLPDDIVSQLEDATTRAMAATGAPGAIAGVWVPWAGEWMTGLGETAPGSGEQPATDMTFRAGEITRSMTCDVLYELDDAGRVSLNDPVMKYVQSTPQLDEITLVDLCDGVAGIAASEPLLWNQISSNRDRVWKPREFAAAGLGRGMGEYGVWRDSDTSYFLLGIALENATRTSMADLYTEYVTAPLGLTDTQLPSAAAGEPGARPLPGHYTSFAARKNNCVAEPGDVTTLSSSIGYANGGVVTTLPDLRDYAFDLARRAGTSEDLGDRWANSLPTNSDGDQWVRYAGGDLMYGPMIGQAGDIVGYSTAAFSDIDTGLTVAVVLNNSAGGNELAGALARELAAIAAEVPGTEDRTVSLPWTIDQARSAVNDAAVCPID
ncbi:serine hydrolase domain-containing protein [Microbacterium amylolyticum]|uniref:D-alanyl-D-alanine carboxypeptidase n=1 Tax=Microbacterium amylolyticum TaxID=936337 RepID=A0ABS4ZIB9_9MICO|nr:serine hydrolase domain-containing protein [Microbacterium amylolyticum]MBP2437007.1 D-alanyl-D-alanine carboxypeptidase [Microbacterium amylolyticum]